MTIDNAATLNADPDSAGVVDPSPTDALLSSPDSRDLDAEPAKESASSEETLKTDQAGAEDRGGKEAPPEPKAEDELPFHNHPRWKEVMAERDELKNKLAELSKAPPVPPPPEQPPPAPKYRDIAVMEDEELREWQESDPKGYAANLYAQIEHEIKMNMKKEEVANQSQDRIVRTLEDHKSKYPDFEPMWQSGEIKKFMSENLGHNAISAHLALTQEKRVKEATAKAVKEAEEKMLANFKAKKEARVLGSGPSVSGGAAIDKELENTLQHGGRTSVLANKLALLRRKAG